MVAIDLRLKLQNVKCAASEDVHVHFNKLADMHEHLASYGTNNHKYCWRSNGRAVHRPSLTEQLQITHRLTRTVECKLLIYLLIYINILDSSNIVLHVDRYIRPCVDYLLFILIF